MYLHRATGQGLLLFGGADILIQTMNITALLRVSQQSVRVCVTEDFNQAGTPWLSDKIPIEDLLEDVNAAPLLNHYCQEHNSDQRAEIKYSSGDPRDGHTRGDIPPKEEERMPRSRTIQRERCD